MSLTAYILESLKQYGKAELGSLGCFYLDYTPSRWSIISQYFDPPKTRIIWRDGLDSTNSEHLVNTIAQLHGQSKELAASYVKGQINRISDAILEGHEHQADLGILGKLSKNQSTDDRIKFEINQNLVKELEYSPISVKPLTILEKPDSSWNIIKWLGILGLLVFLFWLLSLVNIYEEPSNSAFTQFHNSELMPGTKDINSIPILEDTASIKIIEEEPLSDSLIIITGTFCKKNNIDRMKEKILLQDYELFEEFLPNQCVRLGIRLQPLDDKISNLIAIKKNIEPTAWLLKK